MEFLLKTILLINFATIFSCIFIAIFSNNKIRDLLPDKLESILEDMVVIFMYPLIVLFSLMLISNLVITIYLSYYIYPLRFIYSLHLIIVGGYTLTNGIIILMKAYIYMKISQNMKDLNEVIPDDFKEYHIFNIAIFGNFIEYMLYPFFTITAETDCFIRDIKEIKQMIKDIKRNEIKYYV